MKPLYLETDRLLAVTVIKLLPRSVTPNFITACRFVLTPVVFILLIFQVYLWSGIIFLIAAFSDALDGALARTTNRITEWGKLFDPLADKLLVGSTAAILVTKYISLPLALAIVAIELFLILTAYYYKYHLKLKDVQANYLGKTKMILQSVGLIALYASAIGGFAILITVAQWILSLSVIFAVLSFFGYRSI